MSMLVVVPDRLNLSACLTLRESMRVLPEAEEYTFDFGRMNWITPFGFLFVSASIDDFARGHPNSRLTALNFDRHHYHAHMGFFRAFGLDFGNDPGQATGSMRYVPITIQRTDELQARAYERGVPLGEAVECEATRLARILARAEEGEIVDTLAYALREIMRNVLEHSESTVLEFCAQYWPTQDRVEIAIMDRGVGVPHSLAQNQRLRIENEQHALNLSLLPGISANASVYRRSRSNGIWDNSGYGLYMTSRLCRLGGGFFLGSRTASIRLKEDSKEYLPFDFEGTVLRLVLKPSRIGRVRDALSRFSNEGQQIARELRNAHIGPSTASQMLSRDFGTLG